MMARVTHFLAMAAAGSFATSGLSTLALFIKADAIPADLKTLGAGLRS